MKDRGMKEVREVLDNLSWRSDPQFDGTIEHNEKVAEALAEIKKIMLDWVGSDKEIKPNDDSFDDGFDSGYNYRGADIKKKIEDSYEANRR